MAHIQQIIEKLKQEQNKPSTSNNYHSIWKKFNSFLIRLDHLPSTWEERLVLYVGYMAGSGLKSTTIKSYISAIRKVLTIDGYEWSDQKLLLNSLTRACHLINDRVRNKLPIQNGLLEMLLFELERVYEAQNYLEIMYKSLYSMAYYGLFRVGELTSGDHPIRAKDIHSAGNKDKFTIYLHSSKTHGRQSRPQCIKIEGNLYLDGERNASSRCFDPYELTRDYLLTRGDYEHLDEPLYIFQDRSPVRPCHMRSTLKLLLSNLHLNPAFYGTHSFRSGRATDLMKYGYEMERIKYLGRWRSNAVYKYLKP